MCLLPFLVVGSGPMVSMWNSKGKDWDELLDLATCAINCHKSAENQLSPYEVLLGRRPDFRFDALNWSDIDDQKDGENAIGQRIDEIEKKRKDELDKIGKVRDLLIQRRDQRKQKEYDDWWHLKPRGRKWQTGDLVLIRDMVKRPGNKFDMPFIGPFRIFQTLPNGNVRLSTLDGHPSMNVINGNRLKMYHAIEPGVSFSLKGDGLRARSLET